MALLISSNRPDLAVYAQHPGAGFTQDEINRIVDANGKAFRLQTGGLLVVGTLLCKAWDKEINITATCLLRRAVDGPGVDVCGDALLLGPEESERLSESVQSAFCLGHPEEMRTALLLDPNEAVRHIIAIGLERQRFRVIQARTAADTVGFCQTHSVEALIADVTSLQPDPVDTLRYMRESQALAGVLVTSGYDRFHIERWYPGLLNGVQFLHKPFSLGLLGLVLQQMVRPAKTQQNAKAERLRECEFFLKEERF